MYISRGLLIGCIYPNHQSNQKGNDMDTIRNKREWILWCHDNYENSRQSLPPPEYPIAAEWDIDGDECSYPTYYTLKRLKEIVASLKNMTQPKEKHDSETTGE